MAASSAQEPSEWDEDPAWSRPDPMTAAELEAGLDRVCDQDEGRPTARRTSPGTSSRSPRTSWPEIREAAADELLAVEAATTGRRGPGQPGSARIFPGESSSPAAGFGPGMALDVLPGCAGPGGRRGRRRRGRRPVRRGVGGRADRGAVRVGPGRGPRRRPQARRSAELARRNPAPEDAGVHRRPGRVRAGRVPRPGRGPGRPGPDPGNPAARHRRGAGRRDGLPVQGRDHRPRHRPARRRRGPRRRGQGPGPGRPADPRRAARRDRRSGDGGRPGEGEGTAGGGGEGRPGGAVGRGLRQRRADGLRAAPRRGAGRGPADHRLG